MELRDFVVTPVVILLVLAAAFMVRGRLTDDITRRYFIPALAARILGALAVGFIYQFYYNGGDTFAFHTHGSRVIWEAFLDSPEKGIRLLLANGDLQPTVYNYASKIWYYQDPQSYFVIRILAVIDLFTFSSYSATAVVFATISFSGAWVLFQTFYRQYPEAHGWLALSCLFVPTVFFWGSGIFKDTLTLAALGWATFACYNLFLRRRRQGINVLILLIACWVIYSVKKYILLSFLPALLLWIFIRNFSRIRSLVARALLVPFVVAVVAVLAYYTILKVAEDDPRYNISKLAQTAKITAYDIRYGWGARTGEGSGYTLGTLDGTWQSMIALAPGAINVSLFRPYLWEVRNSLMLLSSLESTLLLFLTLYVVYKARSRVWAQLVKPDVLFCLFFALVFAFAVGVSTYNFGTLSRYKIPLTPFYLVALGLIHYSANKERKLAVLEMTE